MFCGFDYPNSDCAMTDTEIDQMAFEMFAKIHPHECYATYPERFWEFFHREYPTITREEMIELINDTNE
jgi:hypothetical protein